MTLPLKIALVQCFHIQHVHSVVIYPPYADDVNTTLVSWSRFFVFLLFAVDNIFTLKNDKRKMSASVCDCKCNYFVDNINSPIHVLLCA